MLTRVHESVPPKKSFLFQRVPQPPENLVGHRSRFLKERICEKKRGDYNSLGEMNDPGIQNVGFSGKRQIKQN
jgi:hypothetical protein